MRRMIKALMMAGTAAALLAFAAPAAGAHPRVASAAAAPDFSLSTNYSSTGILFPGETSDPHPWCQDCDSYGGPHYPVDIFGSCDLDFNTLAVMPLNGFDAPVTLSVSGLPTGVTSRMPGTVMIPAPGYPFIGAFALDASSSVPLGTTFPVTLTATSGSLVHTITRTVTVSNQVPAPCDNSTTPWPALRYNMPFGELIQNQVVTVDIILRSPAPAGGTVVTFTSSDPTIASAPASVTIPAGLYGAPVQISAHRVSSFSTVTFTTSANGNTISAQVGVAPASPPAETVMITQAQFDSSTGELLLFAKDPNDGGVAVLTVLDASTHQVIGTMNNLGQGLFGAVLPVTAKPSKIRVVSSITGASATATVN